MGLLASQLGNVVQSSVTAPDRSQAGGLQYTAQNLGSSLGTALIGAILIGALASVFTARVANNPLISEPVRHQTGVAIQSGISFVSTGQVQAAATDAGVPAEQVTALVEEYGVAQLNSLKTAILAAAGITLLALAFTRNLPAETPEIRT